MKIAEVKGLSTKELKERVDAEAASLNQMKINHSVSPLDNPAQIKQLRRTIARLKTELHQREQKINNE
jgi:large subunit ribosomal protein L29